MGLDQYANARKGEPTLDEDGYKHWEDSKELAYWRKHPNLQGFMERIYIAKGGTEEFNCVDVELDLSDINTLEVCVKGDELPETGGFFFGDDSSDYYKESDLEFCANARKALADGQTVVYSSWW